MWSRIGERCKGGVGIGISMDMWLSGNGALFELMSLMV